ncbi:hypothetical protein PENSTE_c034G03910 [Penicillium steckii]|uniref:AAA+ ATPase domain-containing protein n=1 Tax=Penicillium steckii TaxID=303698 RepID=A0A1V6SLN4_9EURO|nr:hypothetical protein PENSTE_c034G03910 [Penicillium steckii]
MANASGRDILTTIYLIRESNDISELPRQRDDLGHEVMSKDHPPDDPFPLLLPAEIIGFGFHDRKWRSLTVDHIDEIKWNRKAFENLVVDSDHKDVIEALVTSHTAATKSTDFMEGKGNGLILLLHGGPGTGKTLTAESVAELTHKPLYRIFCGDIGTNVEEVEKYLKSVLYIGTVWECVVLLDEADVFLEERQTDQLQRNAQVSIFLRALEYYDGILILTSNRVGTFDEAFKSRIHVSLHYPYLNKQSRHRIWLNFIDSLGEKDAKIDDIKKGVNFLAKQRLNGREIRNTVKMAMQLAQFYGKRLEYSHLERIMDISTKFSDYLKDVHGHSDSEWALNKGLRGQERKHKS